MLITLEGIDGSGKSTLYKGLQGRLSDLDVVFTREPGSPYLGEAVRKAIAKNNDPLVEAALFVADHAVHLADVIRPALVKKQIVISDRYIDSRFAYQQVSLKGVHPDPLGWLKAVHKDWSITPDLTFLLLIDPEKALMRISERSEGEHFEQKELLEVVQQNYIARMEEEPFRFVAVDATLSPETILNFVEKSIREHITWKK